MMRLTDCKAIVSNANILIDDIEDAIFVMVETTAERLKIENFFKTRAVRFSIPAKNKIKVSRTVS